MTSEWVERQRRTNRLVREVGSYLFKSGRGPTHSQLYGLCKLTWITKNYDTENSSYIYSTKLPALMKVFGKLNFSLEEAAEHAVSQSGNPALRELILSHTGFTNYYNAFRNSSEHWMRENVDHIRPLAERGLMLRNDADRVAIMERITALPPIPRGDGYGSPGNAGHLLSPLFFALDPDRRFPIINGKPEVTALLERLNVSRSSPGEQCSALIALYGRYGIRDAAELDQADLHLRDITEAPSPRRPTQPLRQKPLAGKNLSLKDEQDYIILLGARRIDAKRMHNELTNKLLTCLAHLIPTEGDEDIMYDACIPDHDGSTTPLLIEAKSSIEAPHIRMAIGQLYDYWFQLHPALAPNLAILVPEEPAPRERQLLGWLGIGILWFSGDTLCTSTPRLERLASDNGTQVTKRR